MLCFALLCYVLLFSVLVYSIILCYMLCSKLLCSDYKSYQTRANIPLDLGLFALVDMTYRAEDILNLRVNAETWKEP